MRPRRTFALAFSALALVAAGCGGDDDKSATVQDAQPNPTTGGESAEDAGGGGASAEGTVEIVMKGFAFEPKEATVKVGQTVTWRNEDDAKHDAFSEESGLDTDDIGKNGTTQYKPDKAGTINYICSIHPSMKATLIVEE
jgi:plastocyanin